MYTVTSKDPVLKTALEEKLQGQSSVSDADLKRFFAEMREALETLPYARTLLERKDYVGLDGYIGELIEDFDNDERLENALKFSESIDEKLEAHLKNEPMNHNSHAYWEWLHERGRLEGWLQAAQADILYYKKVVLEPAKRNLTAIQTLQDCIHSHVDATKKRVAELRQAVEKLISKEPPEIQPIMRRIWEARINGEPEVRIQATKNGKVDTFRIAASYFFKD